VSGHTCTGAGNTCVDPTTHHIPYYPLPSSPENVDPLGGPTTGTGSPPSTFNVALKFPPGGDGICGPSGCFIPLDANSPTGYQVNGDRVQLPKKICQLLSAPQGNGSSRPTVVFSDNGCNSKTEGVPTCGPWSSVLPSSANLKVQCASTYIQPCLDCAAQNCLTEANACFGNDWVHGNWGSVCGDALKCICSLTDQQFASDGGNNSIDVLCGFKNNPAYSACDQSGCFGSHNNDGGTSSNPFDQCFQTHCKGLCDNSNSGSSSGGGCGNSGGGGPAPPSTPPPAPGGPGNSCNDIKNAGQSRGDSIYSIDLGNGVVQQLYCDMTVEGGGWTLVGKIGTVQNLTSQWLRSDVNVAALGGPAMGSGTFASVNAVALAVQRSSQIRLSNSSITRWVRWDLPQGRTVQTWWNHAAGQAVINGATQTPIDVFDQNLTKGSCFQNIYGINPWPQHGGSFPSATQSPQGNTSPCDLCMSVGVLPQGLSADGFTQNGNGYDQPTNDSDWPNQNINATPPYVAVWLR
jgi:hypothetical protein